MIPKDRIARQITSALSLLLLATLPSVAPAEEEIEELVVIGTRAQPRSVVDSSVPIDVIDSENLLDQGSNDMNFILRTLVPSFHVNMQPGRDSAAVQNPINLRGLAPDHTLVLVNGKRRHRGASITWISDGRSNGAQGPDLSVIPAIALKQVEVLRDGAAAQYGSDAIAGVINFVLKDDSEGATLEVRHGWHDEGSSEDRTRVSGNVGLPLGDQGFINASFEYSSKSPTDRSVLRSDVERMIKGGNTHIADPAHVWGSPDIDDNIKTFVNLGAELDADRHLYAFGNYASREVTTGFFYREPEDEAGLFAQRVTRAGETYHIPLIYDRTMPDNNYGAGATGVCNQYAVRLTAAGLPPNLEELLADDDCFSYHEWFPGGFQPQFGAEVTDYSLVIGTRGVASSLGSGLSYDISISHGGNEADYFLHQSVNPSWGPDSPTSFDVGNYAQRETNVNLDLSYMANVGLASDLNIAGGLEWRKEEFEISLGEPPSWDKGKYVRSGAKNGSNGFGGFSETAAGKWKRGNIATYLDIEVDIASAWTVGGAVRWEDFDDFGTETTAKVSTRIQASKMIALRASLGTGFRAPTPGQQNAYNIATIFDPTTVEPVESGTVPSDSPLAAKFGGKPLEPETSNHFTAGAVFEMNSLIVTADYFQIDVDDRIFLSEQIKIADRDGDGTVDGYGVAIDDEALSGFEAIQFFQNDFDTKTEGIDLVLTYSLESDIGNTDFQLFYNHTKTTVTQSSNLSRRGLKWIEEGAPKNRYSATVNHVVGDWRFMLRYHHFGSWYSDYDSNNGVDGIGGTADDVVTHYGGYGLADISIARRIGGIDVTLGADNVLDQTPERSVARASRGNLYPRFAPGGIDGRFIYGRVTMEF